MPRVHRRRESEETDPTREPLAQMAARAGDPFDGMSRADRKAAEAKRDRRRAKFKRRIAEATARWQRMPVLERKAWADAWLASRRQSDSSAAMPKAAEMPLMYAIVTVCEADERKADKRHAKRVESEKRQTAREAAARAAERAAAVAESPAPATEDDPTPDEPRKRRKRRRGPRYGVVGIQLPDGSMQRPIYDDDEDD